MTEHLLEIQQKLDSPNEAIALFGNQDAYLKLMENELNVSIITRG
ncbi:phosphate starvation-inducible protein PhoH, partial [Bacillus sp. JR_15]